MTPDQIIAHRRRPLLELAQELGNVSEACRHMVVSRTRYYEWKKGGDFFGLDALTPKDPRRPQQLNETPSWVVADLLSIAAVEPTIGCRQYANRLADRGYRIGKTAVQEILVDHGLGRRHQRAARAAALAGVTTGLITDAAREDEPFGFCHYSPDPGGLIALDSFYIGNLKGVGKSYQLTAIDTATRWAMVLIVLGTPTATTTIRFLDQVVRRWRRMGHPVRAVLTDNGPEYNAGAFSAAVAAKGLVHVRIPPRSPNHNAVCERFQDTALQECWRPAFHRRRFSGIRQLQLEIDAWLVHHHHRRRNHSDYLRGRIPAQMLTIHRDRKCRLTCSPNPGSCHLNLRPGRPRVGPLVVTPRWRGRWKEATNFAGRSGGPRPDIWPNVTARDAVAENDQAAAQRRYHDERFSQLANVAGTREVIEDLSGSLLHEAWLGLDQMGHFGPHGCELVADAIAERSAAIDLVVELGSGYGGALRDVVHRLRGAGVGVRAAVGSELVVDHCRAAACLGERFERPPAYVAADAAALPLDGGTADVVFAAGSMPHFRCPGHVVGEAYRVLRPHGLLVVAEEVSLVREGGTPPAAFLDQHPPGVFTFSSVADRRAQLGSAGFAEVTFRDLTTWAADLVTARLRALRLLRGTAARVYGEPQVDAIDTTLAVTLDAYRSGVVVPGIFTAVRAGRG